MLIALHKNAHTTPAVRAEIAARNETASVLAQRSSITEQTVNKWKQCDAFANRSHTAHHLQTALLHKPEDRRNAPSPRRNYAMAPTGTVLGRPSCVKRLSRATRTCNSTTCRSNVRAITRWPRRLKQCILVSTRLLR